MDKLVRFKKWLCKVEKLKYSAGGVALVLVDARDGQKIATATVNIPEVTLGEGQVLIKDWSENEGMLKCLSDAGIVRANGAKVATGHVHADVCELLI